uniref:Uncharacterized protein n=1 Tax=Ditylum brightwellii TaxID=49249 RepID=A0A6V2G927_9STRA|mmetsp:Transcript_23818/g.31589  ORF Transcript_23818/g.31589 Transcript_23818/m.31589 type:complete len:135 (-) Transcript_23818:84-488(-)
MKQIELFVGQGRAIRNIPDHMSDVSAGQTVHPLFHGEKAAKENIVKKEMINYVYKEADGLNSMMMAFRSCFAPLFLKSRSGTIAGGGLLKKKDAFEKWLPLDVNVGRGKRNFSLVMQRSESRFDSCSSSYCQCG